MGDAAGIKAGDAYVAIGADDRGLQRALNNVANRFRGMGSVVSGLGAKMVGLGASITAPLAAAAVNTANAGAALYDMSRRTGISASALSSLGFAASLTGTDMETLEGSIRKMQKTIAGLDDVHEGTSAKAIQEIGIQAEALKGLSPDEQFRTIAAAIAAIHDPTLRAAETMKIFGKSGTSIIPMIQDLAQLEEYAKRMGFVKNNASAKEAKELSIAFQLAERAMKSLWGAAASAVLPIIKEKTAAMIRATMAVRDWVKLHKEGIATAFQIGVALTVAGTAFLILGKAISIVGVGFSGLSAVISIARGAITGSIAVVAGVVTTLGSVPVILAGVAAYLIYTSGVGKSMLSALGGYFGDLFETAKEAFGGIKNALAAGDWKLAAEIAWAGLKLAWATGIQPLKTMWSGLKEFASNIWASIGDTIVEWGIRGISALKNAWENFKAWIKNLWEGIEGWIEKKEAKVKYEETVKAIDKGIGKKDPEAGEMMKELAKADYDKEIAKIEQKHKADIDGNNKVRDAAIKANEKETAARLRAVKQLTDAEAKRAAATSKEEIRRTQDELNKKTEALKELNKRAAAVAAKKKDRFGDLPSVPDLPTGPTGLPPDDMDRVMKEVKAAGTFNASGAFGLAAGGTVAAQQLAEAKATRRAIEENSKAVEKTGKLIERLMSLG